MCVYNFFFYSLSYFSFMSHTHMYQFPSLCHGYVNRTRTIVQFHHIAASTRRRFNMLNAFSTLIPYLSGKLKLAT